MMRRIQLARQHPESGLALIPVLGYTMILTLLLSVTAIGGQQMIKISRTAQDRQTAVQAAYAGLNDYLARANADTAYTQYSHVPPTSCAGASPPAALDPDNRFMGASMSEVPGGTSSATMRYTVNSSKLCTQGIITLTAIGKSQGVTKTIDFTLRRRSFLDYAYFSDFEALDPRKYATNPWAPDTVEHVCRRHHYEASAYDATKTPNIRPAPRPEQGLGQTPGCSTINWITGDEVTGPMHTNDAMLICGNPIFNGVTTTSYNPTSGKHYLRNPGCTDSVYFQENKARKLCGTIHDACYAPPLQMPPANSALQSVPGACIYSGPTKFTLDSDSFQVTSPNTPRSAGCYPGPGATVRYPASGVVYVKNVTAGTACTTPAGNLSPRNPVGYPIAGDVTKYGCYDGDAFVSGYSDTPLTIGAQDNIVVVDDINLASAELAPETALGLVANNSIEIYHPVNTAGTNLLGSPIRRIEGSLLTINGSISVQNYNLGTQLGNLTVIGGMAQRWRGLIGTTDGDHGYAKDYKWDLRLQTVSPPHFLEPEQSAWQAVRTQQD